MQNLTLEQITYFTVNSKWNISGVLQNVCDQFNYNYAQVGAILLLSVVFTWFFHSLLKYADGIVQQKTIDMANKFVGKYVEGFAFIGGCYLVYFGWVQYHKFPVTLWACLVLLVLAILFKVLPKPKEPITIEKTEEKEGSDD
jgi:hypothetical protein